MTWVNSLGNMLLRVLRIPPGTSVRKSKGEDAKSLAASDLVLKNDMINAIIDITVNDVCIGIEPLFFVDFKGQRRLKHKVKQFVKEANTIVRDAATDLLKIGYSAYKVYTLDGETKIILFPIIEPLKFKIDKNKKIHVYYQEKDEEVKDCLLFINYTKESLSIDEDKNNEDTYLISPNPIQLKNLTQIGYDLITTERSISNYRKQLSKILRIVTFDAGISQGDSLDNITEQISSMVNSETSALDDIADPAYDFDDAIPVLPNRKGIGKPEIVESIPSADIKSLVDYDLLLKKLFLAMKFPQSYADFSSALGDTAVSTIRGDIRYARMIDFTQTLIKSTLNDFLGDNYNALRGREVIGITNLPNPEDADVVANMRDFTEFADSVTTYIFQAETYTEAKARLDMLKSLYQATSSFKLIEEWEKSMSGVLKQKYGEEYTEQPPESKSPSNSDFEGTFDENLDENAEVDENLDENLDENAEVDENQIGLGEAADEALA